MLWDFLQHTGQPPITKIHPAQIVPILRNHGLYPPAARTHVHAHTHAHTHTQTHKHTMLMHAHTHAQPKIPEAWREQCVWTWARVSSGMMSCWGRPTQACGETHYTWGGSPFPCRPSPRRRRLISCSGPSWEYRETSQQMGFRLVTFSVVRSDYIDSSSGSEGPSVAWCSLGWPFTFHNPNGSQWQTGRGLCSQFYLSKGGKQRNRKKPNFFRGQKFLLCIFCADHVLLKKKYINDRNLEGICISDERVRMGTNYWAVLIF